jgi:hypothetical protein
VIVVLSAVPTTRMMSGSFHVACVERSGLRATANSLPSAVTGNSCSSR